MKWKKVRLGDYISIKSGLAYKGSQIGKGDSILLGMGCVSFKDKFVYSGARLYDDECDDRFIVKPGDIVLATRQQSDNLPILAMPAVIPNEFAGKRVIFGTNLYKVENTSELSNEFLFWLFKHQHYVSYIAGVKSGTAVQMVTKKNVEDYKFLCPPFEVREKISSILSVYDSLIENNTKRIRLLEQMAENLYKEWFVRFRFPGHEHTEFVDGLPKGWKVCKIKDCYKTCSGGTPNREKPEYYINGTIHWVKTGEIQDSIIIETEEKITQDALKHSSAKLLPPNSLLMAIYGVNIGKLGLLTRQMSCNQAACAFLPNKEKQTLYYLFFYLKSIREYLTNIGFGAAQQNLSQATINKIRIIIPVESIMLCFEQKISVLYKQIESLQHQINLLAHQRDLLLPRLMSGKLEVKF